MQNQAPPLPPSRPDQLDINLTIGDVPPQYDDKVVARLVISAISGGTLSDIAAISVRGAPESTRTGVLTIKRNVADELTVGLQHGDCQTTVPTCSIDIKMRPVHVDTSAGKEYGPVPMAGVRLRGGDKIDHFYTHLQLNNVGLPVTQSATPQGPATIYVFTDSLLQVYISPKIVGDQAPSIDVPPPPADSFKLFKQTTPPWVLKVIPPLEPPVVAPGSAQAPTSPGSGQAAQPAQGPAPPASTEPVRPATAAATIHLVLKPASVPGLVPTRTAARLLEILTQSQAEVRLLSARDGSEVPRRNLRDELTKSKDAVVVWSGDRMEGTIDRDRNGFPPRGVDVPLTFGPLDAPPPPYVDQRIAARDLVSITEVKIATPLLYDRWQANIETVTRVYGRDQPDPSNDDCQFNLLIASAGGDTAIPLTRTAQGTRWVLQSAPITSAQLLDASKLKLDVKRKGVYPNCIEQTRELANFTTADWNVRDSPDHLGTMEPREKTKVKMAGRWLLGLYAPQNLGVGIDASSAKLADAQDQIFNQLILSLDKLLASEFQNSQPMRAAVGFDLALMTGVDAATPGFPETSVISGKFRLQPTNVFQLDPEGDRRLTAFLSGPSSAGNEPAFASIRRVIEQYSALFGDFSGEYHPTVVYVGAVRPNPDSCKDWKKMTGDVARLSGAPRVFGIVFANLSSGDIAQRLGQPDQVKEEPLAVRTRAFVCEGSNGSALLLVPFQDLISRAPDTVLGAAFPVLDRWMQR